MTFSTSLSGLKAAQTELDVVSNNLANAETTGFKRSQIAFADVVASSAYASQNAATGIGVSVGSISQDYTIGPIDQTGNALDMAIKGDGFFTVVSPTSTQTLYSRDGHFTTDSAGALVDDEGNQLQMLAPAATTPSTAQVALTNPAGSGLAGVSVTGTGAISATYLDGTVTTVGQVALAQFGSRTGLRSVGSSNWVATATSGVATFGSPGTSTFGQLQIGALEQSNVDTSTELVALITAQRYFQANAKAIDAASQLSQTVINLHA
jgi:flagellar hook protein FlgE